MKATIEFDLDNEKEADHYQCALKAYEMSGLIDSFLDYMIITAALPKKLQPSIEHVYSMFRAKIMQQRLKDMVQEDLQYVLGDYEDYEDEADE